MPNRYFADISNNNPSFDAKAYRKAGHLLIGLKATEGTSFKDGTYRNRRHEAHSHGVAVAHYHFAHPEAHKDGKAEAVFFAQFIHGGVAKNDALVIDIERGTNVQASQHYLDTFASELRCFYPHDPLILYRSLANHTNLKDSRLWVAAYNGRKMPLLTGIQTWAHQFTDGVIGATPHSCAGIGQCDVSRLNMRSYLRLRGRRK